MGTARYAFALATQDDDAALRALLRDNAMPGRISLTLEREPSFFAAAAIEGEQHQTLVARDASGAIVGLASRACREVFVDGAPRRVGYFAQARIAAPHRGRRALLGGFARAFRELHADGAAPWYVTTIVADNLAARRLFEAEWKDKPTYRRLGVLRTLAIPLWRARRARPPAGLALRPADVVDLPRVADCLQRNLRRYQLAPCWRAEALADERYTRGLRPRDFIVAERAGRLVGTIAVWDQSAFKQSVVRGYGGWLARLRPLVNAVVPGLPAPLFPAPGQRLLGVFLSHLAVDEEAEAAAPALVGAALDEARRRGFALATLGLTEGHPWLAPVAGAFGHVAYRSVIYAAHWPDAAAEVAALSRRPPLVELAVL